MVCYAGMLIQWFCFGLGMDEGEMGGSNCFVFGLGVPFLLPLTGASFVACSEQKKQKSVVRLRDSSGGWFVGDEFDVLSLA